MHCGIFGRDFLAQSVVKLKTNHPKWNYSNPNLFILIMKFVVFDTETTGLPEGRNPSLYDSSKWPHIVQLSWAEYDTVTFKVVCHDHIIRPPAHVVISPESTAIHRIDRAICDAKGIDCHVAIMDFVHTISDADVIVAHNMSFDKKVLIVEGIRNSIPPFFDATKREEVCTMKDSTEICKIPATFKDGTPYFKFPKLSELHIHLFTGEIPDGLHNSMVDVMVCLRCFVFIRTSRDIGTTTNAILNCILCAPVQSAAVVVHKPNVASKSVVGVQTRSMRRKVNCD
jgi:DNA polymerase III epsilon subunit-like protein